MTYLLQLFVLIVKHIDLCLSFQSVLHILSERLEVAFVETGRLQGLSIVDAVAFVGFWMTLMVFVRLV